MLKYITLEWDCLRIYHEMYNRISMFPHDGQSSNATNKALIAGEMELIKSGLTPLTQSEDRQMYEAALARRPEDASLNVNFAQFLDGNGLESEALEYAYRFRNLLPDIAWTHYYLAIQLANNGQYAEAEASCERALEIVSPFTHAENRLKALRGRSHWPIRPPVP